MLITINYGMAQAAFEVDDARVIGDLAQPPPGIADPASAVRAALEEPFEFPPLRLALTPDDHVAVMVDDSLPRLMEILVPTLEHVLGAGVAPGAITLVSPPKASQSWLEALPEAFQDVQLEVHAPAERRKLSYLATTKKDRRIYLNRTAVDADQVVVLSGRRYDPILGHGGAEGFLFPYLCDEAARKELARKARFDAPTEEPWPASEEAMEAAWLLGAPFFVQVIEAAGDGIESIVAGSVEASEEGRRLQDACWRLGVPQAADVVVAAVSGDPARHTFADLAAALLCASRVVRPEGRIVLLTEACPTLGRGVDILRGAEDPRQALKDLQKQAELDLIPAWQWAQAACHARINLLSGLPHETAEELFTTPLENAGQAARLLQKAGSISFVPDAHKTLAVIEQEN